MPPSSPLDIVSLSPDALVVLAAENVVVSWNPAAERIFGVTADQATGQRFDDLVAAQAGRPSIAGPDGVQHDELLCRRADGSLIHVRRAMRQLPESAPSGAERICTLSDVTALRAARDHEAVRARWHELLEALPDAVVIVNDSGRIVLFNAQAEAMFGHAASAILGQPMEALLPMRLRARHLPQRTGYLASPHLRPMGQGQDLRGLRADGTEFPVEISLSPVDLDGRRLVMSAVRDTTERQRIEQALQRQNQALERANRAKDHFLASMSHELRTPLNAILGFTGLLLMRLPGPLNEAQEGQLQHVQTSGKHLLSLINDLLDLAKIESGHVELNREPVDARLVIGEVIAALRPVAQSRTLSLDGELPNDDLLVMADRRALHQVLLNLVANGLKFTDEGGVTVRARMQPADEQWPVGGWALHVVDTGVGISPDDQQRLFGAFVQVGESQQRAGEGTGLGLHLSNKLTVLMGGRLTVASRLGEGSCFTLCLPCATDGAGARHG